MTLAFKDGRDGEIVGIDEFTVPEFLAVGEPGGLCADMGMVAHGRGERLGDTLALGIAQRRRLGQEVLRLLPQGGNGLTKLEELLFRVAHQSHKDMALASALAAKAPHDFGEFLVECLRLTREDRGAAAARLCDMGDERKRFFCALYSVVASVTR